MVQTPHCDPLGSPGWRGSQPQDGSNVMTCCRAAKSPRNFRSLPRWKFHPFMEILAKCGNFLLNSYTFWDLGVNLPQFNCLILTALLLILHSQYHGCFFFFFFFFFFNIVAADGIVTQGTRVSAIALNYCQTSNISPTLVGIQWLITQM